MAWNEIAGGVTVRGAGGLAGDDGYRGWIIGKVCAKGITLKYQLKL